MAPKGGVKMSGLGKKIAIHVSVILASIGVMLICYKYPYCERVVGMILVGVGIVRLAMLLLGKLVSEPFKEIHDRKVKSAAKKGHKTAADDLNLAMPDLWDLFSMDKPKVNASAGIRDVILGVLMLFNTVYSCLDLLVKLVYK